MYFDGILHGKANLFEEIIKRMTTFMAQVGPVENSWGSTPKRTLELRETKTGRVLRMVMKENNNF